jgi:arginyl-tRNA synthetase
VDFLGRSYARGATAFKEDPSAKEEITDLNKKIYELDKSVKEMYEKGRSWSLEYFETLYARLGTKFDYYYFERETGKQGFIVSKKLLKKGVFEESDGAIIFRAEKYGLHTRVFVNKLGLPTYEAKDLGLAKTKYEDYPYGLSLIITDNSVDEYFKVVLKAMEFIYPEYAKNTRHISHGMLRLKSGKMSSRTGKIVAGDTLMNEVQAAVLEKMEDEDEVIADKIAIAAIKYGILKNNIGSDIVFDKAIWLSLTGDTGPYLQYTYARANSVIKNSNKSAASDTNSVGSATKHGEKSGECSADIEVNQDELTLLRTVYLFPEVAADAAKEYSPGKLCVYLNVLARRFNTFYNNNRILDVDDGKVRALRLLLTTSVRIIMKRGLWLLGIESPERM